jgi:Ran GTPase-activating protein (RanGAP) involved in mRNA processing and transport
MNYLQSTRPIQPGLDFILLWSDIGVERVVETLRHNTILTSLYLGYNNIGAVGTRILVDEGALKLAEALRHNTTLTLLDLTCDGIGPLGARALAEALMHNTTLTSLNLTQNRMSTGID